MFKINTKILLVCFITVISFLQAARTSMEFTSAKTYARIEKNLVKAAEFGLLALDKEPNNSYIPYFLAKEVFMMQKKQKEAGEMFLEALRRPDKRLEKPFKIGKIKYDTVHKAITLYADEFYNAAIDYFNKQEIDETKNMISICLKLDEKHIRSYILLSEIESKSDSISKAIEYLDKALEYSTVERQIFDLNLQKATYLRKGKKFEKAKNILLELASQEGFENDIILKRSLFFLYIDMNEIEIAIPYGIDLLYKMENDPNTKMSLISECAFNLAILYRNKGATIYNEIIKYFSDTEISNEKTNNQLIDSETALENYQNAKDYFQLSLDYDDEGSETTKQFKKEMRKIMKKMKNEIIPSLESLLK